jgi:copper(I)-binding protein
VSRFAGTHLAVRVAAAAVGAAAIMLASGCGAGQIAETAKIQSAVPGASGLVLVPPDPADKNADPGQILAQNVTVQYQGPAGYKQGESAPLDIRIINNSPVNVRLIGATSPLGTVTPGGGAAPQAAPAATGSPSATPSGEPSANPSGSAAPNPQPTAAPAAIAIVIPANQIVELVPGAPAYLQISNLTQDLKPGDNTNLSLSFENLSEPSATINDLALTGIPIGPPDTAASREAVDVNEGGE